MRTQCKRLILLVVAGAAVTFSTSFALTDAARPTSNVPHLSSAVSKPLLGRRSSAIVH